jgi:hypothetical protein
LIDLDGRKVAAPRKVSEDRFAYVLGGLGYFLVLLGRFFSEDLGVVLGRLAQILSLALRAGQDFSGGCLSFGGAVRQHGLCSGDQVRGFGFRRRD